MRILTNSDKWQPMKILPWTLPDCGAHVEPTVNECYLQRLLNLLIISNYMTLSSSTKMCGIISSLVLCSHLKTNVYGLLIMPINNIFSSMSHLIVFS